MSALGPLWFPGGPLHLQLEAQLKCSYYPSEALGLQGGWTLGPPVPERGCLGRATSPQAQCCALWALQRASLNGDLLPAQVTLY